MTAIDPPTSGESVALRERLREAVYEVLFDPRCDSEGAVWDDACRTADAIAERLGPDDLDALVGSEAKDAESVYWFAKAAVRADRARLPRHRDIVWNIWNEHVQRRVGWLHEGLTYHEAMWSSIEVVTDPHDGADCPFLDGDDIPMVVSDEPMVIAAPSTARPASSAVEGDGTPTAGDARG